MSVVYWLEKFCTPSGRVCRLTSPRTSSGRRNAFQLATNARMPTVTTAGRDSGSTIRQRKPSRPAPSMAAASSSSRGMADRNGRRMTIVSGNEKATCGRITA